MSDVELDDVPADEGPAELEEETRRSRLRLENAATLRRHLILLYDRVRRGQLDALEANRQARLLREIGRVNEELGVEKRLRRLEQLEEAKRRPRR